MRGSWKADLRNLCRTDLKGEIVGDKPWEGEPETSPRDKVFLWEIEGVEGVQGSVRVRGKV